MKPHDACQQRRAGARQTGYEMHLSNEFCLVLIEGHMAYQFVLKNGDALPYIGLTTKI